MRLRLFLPLALLLQSGVVSAVAPNGKTIPQEASIRIDFDRSSITSTSLSGEAGVAGRLVTADDPVRVASISKLVGALAVMRLVDQGKVDLDRDVSDYLGWRLRNPSFPDTPITLRLLLSHRAGIRDKVDYILPLDGELSTVLANPAAWDSAHAPGTYFSYSNLNSPVIAATLEGATGERFDKLVARLVLEPLKLDACFNWHAGCSQNRRAQAVTLLRPNGDLAKDAAGPEACALVPATDGSCDPDRYILARNGSAFSPQGGLRISAHDLAKIGQVMLNKGKPLLSRTAFKQMTGEAWGFDGKNGDDVKGYFTSYGLGVHRLRDAKGRLWIGHVGEAYSLRAGFWMEMKARKGFVRYVTMVDEFAPVGHCFDRCP
ncbi:serine hydrolase domain-containing protein [Sphingorhabdus sp.]|jgi:CubicO group peptidase (beta-lactamase class C family)|nr:beta-lactamase family protein [Sphingomonadales bacterium]